MLRGGDRPEDILARIFGDLYDVLDTRPVRFHCPCSKARVERAFLLLGESAIAEMIEESAESGSTEVICQFCNAKYYLSTSELEQLHLRTRTRESAA
jgi:molecular chaperone Hsp33